MLFPFLALGMRAPGRQRSFREAVGVHLALLLAAAWAVRRTHSPQTVVLMAQLLLITGIVEGAFLIGWRLSQLPRSQALEFLLVSPVQPRHVYLAEALVGLGRLALVTLSGAPILVVLSVIGYLDRIDLVPLLVMPFTWGAVTGLGLTAWAYEPLLVRRWGERVFMLGVLVYLTVGVLAGENLRHWLAGTPVWFSRSFMTAFQALHIYNPFGVLQYWMERHGASAGETEYAWEQFSYLQAGAMVAVGLLLLRAGSRLKGHFHERHYRPITDQRPADLAGIGNRPLSWWAVKRVTEYTGRVNVLLAGGFGLLYAVYLVGADSWPPWMGRRVFQLIEQVGGLPTLATALVILSAVPAAFQYGLWDSNAQDRCRRLELLLLTELEARDFWTAAAAAAWRRGRGYFLVAVALWAAAAVTQRLTLGQVAAALTVGGVLWGLYFTLGFRAFSRGHQANGLGAVLTLGLPFLAWVLFGTRLAVVAGFLPPGSVYSVSAGRPPLYWLPGTVLAAALILVVTRHALTSCDAELRQWYERHHGRKVLD